MSGRKQWNKQAATSSFLDKKTPQSLIQQGLEGSTVVGKDEVTSSNLVSSSKKHLKSSDFGCFLLISATFGTDAVLRIFADHIKYHRQNESEFPTWHRELRVSSLRDSCRGLGLLQLGGNFCFRLDNQFCQFLFAFFLAVGVDISGEAGTVGKFGRIPSFPQLFVDLADAASAGFAALPFVGQEGRWSRFSWRCVYILEGF